MRRRDLPGRMLPSGQVHQHADAEDCFQGGVERQGEEKVLRVHESNVRVQGTGAALCARSPATKGWASRLRHPYGLTVLKEVITFEHVYYINKVIGMGGELVDNEEEGRKLHPVPAVFNFLGIERVTSNDDFTLSYHNGMLEASVKRMNGKTEHVVKHVKDGGFNQITTFEPEKMTRDERNKIIRSRYAKGESQSDLAKKFGLSQARISGIVKG